MAHFVILYRLEENLLHHNTHLFHTRLADIYMITKCFDKALQHYTTALSIQPDYEKARIGMEKLEKLISGVDEEDEEDDDMGHGLEHDEEE